VSAFGSLKTAQSLTCTTARLPLYDERCLAHAGYGIRRPASVLSHMARPVAASAPWFLSRRARKTCRTLGIATLAIAVSAVYNQGMRLAWRFLILLGLVAALAVGGWYYAHVGQFEQLAAVRRVAAAENFAAARAELAWFEKGDEADERLRTLVGAWGRSDPRFDFYLARYVGDPQSSESLRKAFSRELAWREELLPRWAHYWTWQAKLEPDAQITSICDYLDALTHASPVPAITWREVLDLQAILVLAAKPSLALRLSPSNWLDRYRQAGESGAVRPNTVKRPAKPLPDWEGPAAENRD
jgi:hypothetical protein